MKLFRVIASRAWNAVDCARFIHHVNVFRSRQPSSVQLLALQFDMLQRQMLRLNATRVDVLKKGLRANDALVSMRCLRLVL